MGIVNWTALSPVTAIAAGPFAEPWQKLADIPRGTTFLLIEAAGRWSPAAHVLAECGPNGIAGLTLPTDRILLADAPPGALIGRIGGSSASLKADGAFAVGATCIVPVPAEAVGPLFISFNIVARPVQVVSLSLTVSATVSDTDRSWD